MNFLFQEEQRLESPFKNGQHEGSIAAETDSHGNVEYKLKMVFAGLL